MEQLMKWKTNSTCNLHDILLSCLGTHFSKTQIIHPIHILLFNHFIIWFKKTKTTHQYFNIEMVSNIEGIGFTSPNIMNITTAGPWQLRR
jgi:hypothetical protein